MRTTIPNGPINRFVIVQPRSLRDGAAILRSDERGQSRQCARSSLPFLHRAAQRSYRAKVFHRQSTLEIASASDLQIPAKAPSPEASGDDWEEPPPRFRCDPDPADKKWKGPSRPRISAGTCAASWRQESPARPPAAA